MPSEIKKNVAFKIASIAVLSAVTVIFTLIIRIPIAPTRGYINLGDVAIFFTAFTFGPVTALIAGGLGTAMADIISGYAQWAPFSLVIHGIQGLIIGLIAGSVLNAENISQLTRIIRISLAIVGGAIVMCVGYLLAGTIMEGFRAALVELPGNLIQNAAGAGVGLPLALAVIKAYPPILNFKW